MYVGVVSDDLVNPTDKKTYELYRWYL